MSALITLRWYWKKLGGHYHVRCFSGRTGCTLGCNGDLCFAEEEWPRVLDAAARAQVELVRDKWAESEGERPA
jgi:hypothetical protein